MKIETSEIIDMSMNAEMKKRILADMKHELFHKIANEIPFPFGTYVIKLQLVDAPVDVYGRRISISAEVKKDATSTDDVIRLPEVGITMTNRQWLAELSNETIADMLKTDNCTLRERRANNG